LIKPLGFELDETRVKRAGLDYHDMANVSQHENFDAFLKTVKPTRLFACTTKGHTSYTAPHYEAGDTFIFGPETRGLPMSLLNTIAQEQWIKIPMVPNSRSLNLSNSVAVIVYEAWRQIGFLGAMGA
jgi:tRNA (cytidine/uridine-2'-O-)-methyltransferase